MLVRDFILKILTIGDSGVGKTSIVLRYTVFYKQDNHFSHNFLSTIGVECKSKIILAGEKRVRVQLWDTAGQERFRTITSNFYRGAHGVMIVFDVTDRNSFEMVSGWINEISNNCSEQTFNVIVANKSDMKNHRVVSEQEGRKLAEEYQLYYFETSAKTGEGVNDMLDFVTAKILANIEITPTYLDKSKESFLVARNHEEKKQKKKCC